MHGQGVVNSYHATCNQHGYEGDDSSYWCSFDMANKWYNARKQHNKVYNDGKEVKALHILHQVSIWFIE